MHVHVESKDSGDGGITKRQLDNHKNFRFKMCLPVNFTKKQKSQYSVGSFYLLPNTVRIIFFSYSSTTRLAR